MRAVAVGQRRERLREQRARPRQVERLGDAGDRVGVGQRAVADGQRAVDQRAGERLERRGRPAAGSVPSGHVACGWRTRPRTRRRPAGSRRPARRIRSTVDLARVQRAVEDQRADVLRELLGVGRAEPACRRSSRGRSASGRRARRAGRRGRGRRRGCRRWPARPTPTRSVQRWAYCRFSSSVCATPAGDGSTSRSARSTSHSASVRQSIVGVLAPTPRGSSPITSKRCGQRAVARRPGAEQRRHRAHPGHARSAGVDHERRRSARRSPCRRSTPSCAVRPSGAA